ncbi:MAG: hypothetical protein ACI9TH_003659 [Kiritimatiellia bacterium]
MTELGKLGRVKGVVRGKGFCMKPTWIRFALVLLGTIGAPPAGTYWVSPDGQAAWTAPRAPIPLAGKAASTLLLANANTRAGDVVCLRGGINTGQHIQPKHSRNAEMERINWRRRSGIR